VDFVVSREKCHDGDVAHWKGCERQTAIVFVMSGVAATFTGNVKAECRNSRIRSMWCSGYHYTAILIGVGNNNLNAVLDLKIEPTAPAGDFVKV
jgi:hypothetical protein